jgi:putative Mn2+ efflux pump MntP
VNSTDIISILFIALGLSADCFAVAVSSSIALKTLSRVQILRASLSFGIFQALMPALGWLAGRTIVEFISGFDHWLAFLLLAGIGGKMIWESFRSDDDDKEKGDVTRGFLLLTLSVATSIDAFAVGLSFAFLEVNIALASGTIGIIAFIITTVGFLIGKKAGKLIGERAELVGGIVLIVIGIRVLLTHLL